MSTADDNNDQQCNGGGEEKTSNTNDCISCEQTDVDAVTEGIDSMAMDTSTCANCGKEGNSSDMNNCNKCKMVKYCNAACKKKHRTKHKKACERRVADIYDEKLFKEVEPDECPICLIPLPHADQTTTESCCGKRICNGCVYAMFRSEGKALCPFCRSPTQISEEEHMKRIKKLIKKGNPEAYFLLAGSYYDGDLGMPQDHQKARELCLKAGELGCAAAYCSLGQSYYDGRGVEVDKKKAKYYWELAAMGGLAEPRYNLGCMEVIAGNHQRAMKHWIITAKSGHEKALHNVKAGFVDGRFVAKDEYENTLRAYHGRHKEMKSDEREMAAASGIFG